MRKPKHFCRCGNEVNPKRVALGHMNCPTCGEIAARQLQAQRNRSNMPMHKSNYCFLGTGDLATLKKTVRDMTGKSGT